MRIEAAGKAPAVLMYGDAAKKVCRPALAAGSLSPKALFAGDGLTRAAMWLSPKMPFAGDWLNRAAMWLSPRTLFAGGWLNCPAM